MSENWIERLSRMLKQRAVNTDPIEDLVDEHCEVENVYEADNETEE